MGEEIAKGALSYAVVDRMKRGMSAQEAAESAVKELDASLKKRNGYAQPMSVIALDKDGSWGAGTNIEFTFCVANEEMETTVYEMVEQDGEWVTKKKEN